MNSDLAVARIIRATTSAEAKKVADDLQANKIATEEKRQEGRLALAEESGVGDLNRQKVADLKADKGEDAAATVTGLDGKPKNLTEQEAILLRNNVNSMKAEFPGIDDGIAQRYKDLRSNSKEAKAAKKFIREAAGVLKTEELVPGIMEEYGLTREIAEGFLFDLGVSGVTEPSTWEKFKAKFK
jgi:hypothetical protein